MASPTPTEERRTKFLDAIAEPTINLVSLLPGCLVALIVAIAAPIVGYIIGFANSMQFPAPILVTTLIVAAGTISTIAGVLAGVWIGNGVKKSAEDARIAVVNAVIDLIAGVALNSESETQKTPTEVADNSDLQDTKQSLAQTNTTPEALKGQQESKQEKPEAQANKEDTQDVKAASVVQNPPMVRMIEAMEKQDFPENFDILFENERVHIKNWRIQEPDLSKLKRAYRMQLNRDKATLDNLEDHPLKNV